jgi:mevalonate kinase
MIQAFAPGKMILSGEHSVVYGHNAIAMAVNRGVTVTLNDCHGPSRCDQADQRLKQALSLVLPAFGIDLSFTSDLPIGKGMGSSAALSIALHRALAKKNGEQLSFEEEFKRGMILERFFHGNPSGVDHTVSALGSGVLYQKTKGTPTIEPINIPNIQLVVIDSGSAGNTASLVGEVAKNIHRPSIENSINTMGSITKKIAKELRKEQIDQSKIGALFLENHRHLQNIGVSTPILDYLVEESMKTGAYGAKLSGAGGGGIVFALADDPRPIMEHIQSLGYSVFIAKPYSSMP